MTLSSTRLSYRALALAAALALPGLAAAQQVTPAAAIAAFATKAKAQGLSAADLADPIVTSSRFDASMGLTQTYLQQRINGLAVFNAYGAVFTDRAGKVVYAQHDFVPGAATLAPSATPTLTPEQAVVATSVALALPRPVGLRTVAEARVADGITFNRAGISENDIPVRLMYTRSEGKLVLVWNVTIAQLDQQHHWNARIDANTGRLVEQDDYTVSEQSSFSQFNLHNQVNAQRALAFGQQEAPAPASVLGTTGTAAANSLTALALPLEAPNQGTRSVIPLAPVGSPYSPLGWQVSQAPAKTYDDTYSLTPSGKYLTRGNNVAAYDDNSNKANGAGDANYASATSSPDGGATLNFDFPFDQTAGARNNLNAATTNLFYVNNMMHDVMLAHGFDEASGNFQYANVAKDASGTISGKGLDQVRAESQDGGGRNNANFSTPTDGSSGVMQMYLWDNQKNILTISAPSSIAGTYAFASASFGPSLGSLPNGLCGTIVPITEATTGDNLSCTSTYSAASAAAVKGNIALIQRGTCAFSDKAKNAQLNGAIGVIIYDNTSSTTPIGLGGTDASVTIPAIGISGVDGLKIKAALTGTTTATGCAATVVYADWDGSFDNGIVSHEYGHGISNRLTGTKFNSSSCLIGNVGTTAAPIYTQQMGEGWSDFFALWMTTKPGDIGSASRYVGTYVEGQTLATGPGIRTKPYTTDFTRNNLTYGSILSTNASGSPLYQESHSLGEIWTSVLWDLNWQMIYKYGYNADIYGTSGGNNKMLKLVLDACKIQVCNPGFLDGRDALLRADSLTNRYANSDLIWNVFARRGMGYGAVTGDRVSGTVRFTSVKEAFNLPPKTKVLVLASQNSVVTGSALEAFPNPAQGRLTVRTQLNSGAPMHVAVLDLLGKTVLSTTVPVAQMQQTGVELNTSQLASGLYVVRVSTTEGNYSTKVTIQH